MSDAHYTEAKEIATHFHNKCKERSNTAIFGRTISSVQSLLSNKYTKQEILDVVDYVMDVMKVDVYSFGYFSTCINNVLREMKKLQHKEEMKVVRKQIAASQSSIKEEVKEDEQAAERNRNKLRRLSTQSRFGKKSDFDLFTG